MKTARHCHPKEILSYNRKYPSTPEKMVSRSNRRAKQKVKSYKESDLYPDSNNSSYEDVDAEDSILNQEDSEDSESDEDADSYNEEKSSPTLNKSKTRNYKKEDLEEEEDEDLKAAAARVDKTGRKRGRPNASEKNTGRGSKKKGVRNYGPLKDRTCPYCKKVFSIITGLAYHIEHQVCRKLKPEKSVGSTPFPILNPGEEFVTKYGVVSVVKDDRVGDDYGETVLDSNIEKDKKSYRRQIERLNERRNNLTLYQAKLSRKRKERFQKFYRGHCDKQLSDDEFAKATFQEYIPNATPDQILEGIFTLENVKSSSRETSAVPNPMEPKDCYADRIVECVLIKDERTKIMNLDDELEEDGRFTKLDVANSIVAKAQEGNISQKSYVSKLHESGLRVFMKRNLLVEPYNKELFVYSCADCGRVFNTRVGCKQHTDERKCMERSEKARKARLRRLQEIEDSLEIEEVIVKTSNRNRSIDTRKRGRKASKVYPSWMVFYPDRSSIYPEVGHSLTYFCHV